LQTIYDKWLKIYELTPHKGLGGCAPIEVSEQSPSHPPKIRDHRVLDILLAPVSAHRKIDKKGISIDGAFFIAPELVEHVGRKVEVRRDLHNAGIIYVFDYIKGTFLCEARDDALEGQSLEKYISAKKHHKKELREQARALETLGFSCPSPLQNILIDDHINSPKNVIPFQPEADNETIREVRRAVFDIKEIQQDQPSEPCRIIPLKPYISDPMDNSWMTDEDLDKEYERVMVKSRK